MDPNSIWPSYLIKGGDLETEADICRGNQIRYEEYT